MTSLVSLVVTDIVGSTGAWAAHETEMHDDLERHDRVAGEVISDAGGTVFKHTGDGIMAAFDDPLVAVTAAVDLQTAMASTTWSTPDGIGLRIAVHTGSVHERGGDLYGTAVNRASRLVGICPPGAVVTSGAVASLLADRTLDDMTLQDVGTVRLRGFEQPERVFAVTSGQLSAVPTIDAEPDISTGPPTGRLPRIDDELVGRSADLATLWEAVRANTLVTLVGVGGVGKTRLALEVAFGLQDQPDGAWWCDMTAATSSAAVAPVVLDALGAPRVVGRAALDTVIEHLRDRRALVVLDNCEHVIDPVRALVTAVREMCPGVHILATSREAFGLPGERHIPIGSLTPDDAVRLFFERAARVAPELGADTSHQDTVRTICEQLDGIPLAIELAAARCRSLSPGEIADRLHDRFRLLRGGRATSERHRTLQAAVAWSYSMLGDDERAVFDAMAVFAGGSLLDGITAVTGRDEYDALDALDHLIARSLVTATMSDLGTRYRQLETLRQFAEDRLIERGAIEEHRDRHLDWMLALTARFRAGYGTPTAGPNFDRYVAEVDNLRLAVAHATTTGRLDAAFQMLASSYSGVAGRPTSEVLEWIDPLGAPGGWSSARAEVAVVFGVLRYFQGDADGIDRALAAVPREYHDDPVVVFYRVLQMLAVAADVDAGEAMLDRHVPPTSSDRNRAASLKLFAQNVRLFTEPGRAVDDADHAASDELVESVRSSGDDIELAFALICQAMLLGNGGRREAALEAALEADELARTHAAGVFIDLASNALAVAFGRSGGEGGASRREAAADVQRRLLDAVERKSHYLAVAILSGTVLLLVDDDPVTAYVVDHVRLRLQSPFPVLPDPIGRLGDVGAAEVRARADQLTFDDAIRLAVSALDRLIDAES